MSNWSDLPNVIVECIIERMYWIDRIRIRAVCKAWSFSNRHIPAIDDKIPWAMEFSWMPIDDDQISGECRLLDPLSREYIAEKSLRGNEFRVFINATPCASVYGWVLFRTPNETKVPPSYFLYSPFTIEVIKLPEIDEPFHHNTAALSLDATSPKCVIFLLTMSRFEIRIMLCSPGDCSWKTFEFDIGVVDYHAWEADAVYADGVFYCLFPNCQLGAFDIELEEWTILVDRVLEVEHLSYSKLIVCDADLLLSRCDIMRWRYNESWDLYKLDSSKTDWDYIDNLNDHVLFSGCTSFAAPAIGETSQLANTMFFGHWISDYVRLYGSRSKSCGTSSTLYRRCVEATKRGHAWIELPLGGIWRANDLINGV